MMASEYKLPYTAKEINEKLDKIDIHSEKLSELEEEIGNIPTDTYTHPTESGYKHIPSGGESGQTLVWSEDGTAEWGEASGGVGKNVSGTEYTIDGSTVTAGDGAEIFNDYRVRTYDNSGRVSAGNVASSSYSHAEGERTTASGSSSHAEGWRTTASNNGSHAEGQGSIASGWYSHAEGSYSTASGYYSHAEGGRTTAIGEDSHAEGSATTKMSSVTTSTTNDEIITAWETQSNYNKFSVAKGNSSHCEGKDCLALGNCSHAEGCQTITSGVSSHAEGNNTTARGSYSHAEGRYTKASSEAQHAQGKYNIEDTENKYAHIVGNGTADDARSNAHTLDWDGNAWFAGDIYVGGTSQDDALKLEAHPESHPASMITGLSTVATSGSYNDLSDKPTIPNAYTHPAYTARTGVPTANATPGFGGTFSVTQPVSDATGHITGMNSRTITIPSSTATTSANGLMSSSDKTKLNSIATNANNYSLPTASSSTLGGIKVGSNLTISSGVLSATGGKGTGSNAEVFNNYSTNTASGTYSHAEGCGTTASGHNGSHAEGYGTTASGPQAHAEGRNTTAEGYYSHAEGSETIASNDNSHAEGRYTTASGSSSSSHGAYTTAQGYAQAVFGKHNKLYEGAIYDGDTTGSIFIVGVGTSDTARANAFRITNAGQCMGSQSFATTGADYAEYYEWEDGNPNNEDRRGHFVTFAKGRKVRIANDTDNYILGIVSSTPSVIGNAYTDQWQGMYLTDVFGERLTETVEVEEEEVKDEEGNIIETIPAHTETRFIINPNYDHTKPYIGRNERQEWAIIGTHGQLVLIDDGVCEEGDFCTVSKDGTAIKSDSVTKYRVTERIDSTHIWIQIL